MTPASSSASSSSTSKASTGTAPSTSPRATPPKNWNRPSHQSAKDSQISKPKTPTSKPGSTHSRKALLKSKPDPLEPLGHFGQPRRAYTGVSLGHGKRRVLIFVSGQGNQFSR